MGAGCSEATAPLTTINGLWDFTAVLADPAQPRTCSDSGSLALQQLGGIVTGRVELMRTCQFTGSGVVGTSHETDSIAGTVSGRVVAFEVRERASPAPGRAARRA